MRLSLFPAKSLNYNSDNWQVSGCVSHLPSITPTIIPNAGYGGFGWVLKVFEKDGSGIHIALYKEGQLVSQQKVDNGDECVLVPDGGRVEDYCIRISRV